MPLIDVGGGRVNVEVAGAAGGARGVPVVLLHGFAASTFTWREVVPHLAPGRRVIAIDRLGFGRSDRVDGGDYSFAGAVRHTVTVLDTLDIERAVLIGHSAGAGIAAAVALDHPARVAGLVLIAPAVVTTGPPPFVRQLFRIPGAGRVAPAVMRAAAPLFAKALARTWAVGSRVTPHIVAGYLDPLRAEGTAEALVDMTLGDPPPTDLVDRLSSLSCPCIVIAGAADRVVPDADARRVAAATGAGLVVIADAGHLPHEEQPGPTLAAIDTFLATM